jgi:hypothetical protein
VRKADQESSGAFWKLLNDFGLTASVPDEPGTTQYTPLGLELNVELMSIFAGAVNLWDIPLLLDLMGIWTMRRQTRFRPRRQNMPNT